MPRFITYIVTLIATLALISSGAWVLGRFYAMDWLVDASAWILKSSLYFVAFCCAYAVLVGVYHTILSVTGLDKEKGPPGGRLRIPATECEGPSPGRDAESAEAVEP